MKEVFKYLIIFIFALTPVIIFSDSKKAKFLRRLSTAYLIVDLENKVKERDAELNYKPTNEPIKECDKTQIEYREMPWDSAGLYPVLFKDIRIICKKKGDKILFAVGDSITAGLGIKKENTYPFLLTNRFKNTIIINAGISGSNTFHWRRTGILYDRILRQNKEGIDGIIFLLGGNNILFLKHVLKTKAKPSFIVGSIVTLLNEIHSEFQDTNIYITNYPVLHILSKKMIKALENLRIHPPIGKTGPDFSSMAYKSEYLLEDMLHLNEKGHKKMADIWEKYLRENGYE